MYPFSHHFHIYIFFILCCCCSIKREKNEVRSATEMRGAGWEDWEGLCNSKKKRKNKVTNDIGSCLVCWNLLKEEINEIMGTRCYDMEMEYNINFYTILLSHTITPYLIPTGYFFCCFFLLLMFFIFSVICSCVLCYGDGWQCFETMW